MNRLRTMTRPRRSRFGGGMSGGKAGGAPSGGSGGGLAVAGAGSRRQVEPDAGGVARRQRIDRGVERFVGLARRQHPNPVRPAFLEAGLHRFRRQLREIGFVERAADREMDIARSRLADPQPAVDRILARYRRRPCRSARRSWSGWRGSAIPDAARQCPWSAARRGGCGSRSAPGVDGGRRYRHR